MSKVIQVYEDGDSQQPIGYESYEASLTNKTNWSLKNDASKFAIGNYRFHNVSIRTDSAITVKFNATTNDGITVAANTSFTISNMTFQDIFITNTGTAAVKIVMW